MIESSTTIMHCMYLERKMVTEKRKPKEKDNIPDVDISSPWFKIKLDDINYKTIIVIGMIILGIISILKIII